MPRSAGHHPNSPVQVRGYLAVQILHLSSGADWAYGSASLINLSISAFNERISPGATRSRPSSTDLPSMAICGYATRSVVRDSSATSICLLRSVRVLDMVMTKAAFGRPPKAACRALTASTMIGAAHTSKGEGLAGISTRSAARTASALTSCGLNVNRP